MNDYIRLPRSALTDELWRNPYAARLYVYLLCKADENGEWKVSLRQIYADLGLSKKQYHMGLEVLKGASIAASKGSAKTASIILCNTANKRTSKVPKTEPITVPIAAPKTAPKFVPPTDAEVAAYVTERGYHFNPAEFVPFYQARGWRMKGGEPMKDWKAGCRYWETNWKQRHGERFYYEIQQQGYRAGSALRSQADRYSELESAAEAVLRNAPYGTPT